MIVRYIYSACVTIESTDCCICCDPWFGPAYEGSWAQYPPLPGDPVDVIGEMDLIFISHIHPDHYDPRFLRRYLERFPTARIVIGRSDPPFLESLMRLHGFEPNVVEHLRKGDTELFIFPNTAYTGYNIDTSLVVRNGDRSVVNLNDNPYCESQLASILTVCPGGRPDVALLPYAGAGPYPQTYWFATAAERDEAVEKKKLSFLEGYDRYLEALHHRYAWRDGCPDPRRQPSQAARQSVRKNSENTQASRRRRGGPTAVRDRGRNAVRPIIRSKQRSAEWARRAKVSELLMKEGDRVLGHYAFEFPEAD